MSKLRTTEEQNSKDYNYFQILGLDFDEKNPVKIKSSFELCKNTWTQGDVKSRRCIELEKDMFEVMVNDSVYNAGTNSYTQNGGSRAKEAAKLKDIKTREATKSLEDLCKRGVLYKSELVQIARTGKLDAVELEKALATILGSIKYIDNTQNRIPFADYQKISEFLRSFVKPDIYAFLSDNKAGIKVTGESEIQKLKDAKNAVYKDLQPIMTTSKGTAGKNLCGLVDTVFKSDADRTKYNEYLKVFPEVWQKLVERSSMGIKNITTGEIEEFAAKMHDILKKPMNEIELDIAAGIKEFRLTVEGDGSGGITLENCPYAECGKPYVVTSNMKSCPHCARPFEVICWNCGKKTPFTSKNKKCSCGADQKNGKELYTQRVKELDSLLGSSPADLAAISNQLNALKLIIFDYEKTPSSQVYLKVREYETKINAKFPPETPKNVTAKAADGKVNVEWGGGSQSGISYSVIRKAGSAPKNASDGELLDGNVAVNLFCDNTLKSGQPYFYGVTAKRGEVVSAMSVSSVPVTVFEQQTVYYALEYDINNKKAFDITVKLSAGGPAEIENLAIVKGDKTPRKYGEGELVERLSKITLTKTVFSKGKYTAVCKVKAAPCNAGTKFNLCPVTETRLFEFIRQENL